MAEIFGINIDNLSKTEVLRRIGVFLTDGRRHWIATVNPEISLKARKDKEYRGILNKADLRVADGVGIILASWRQREKVKERVAGIDLIYDILKNIKSGFKVRVMIMGGENNSRRKAIEKLKGIFPHIDFAASKCEIRVNDFNKESSLKLNKEIKDFHANILFVALGAPYQERWICKNLSFLPSVKLAIGVGGAVDMISGKLPRAPRFMRKAGLEWLWRLVLEPGRVGRIFNALIVFPCLVIADCFIKSGASRLK